MQIKEIVLYGENKKKRSIELDLGKVNIITGKSRTGKSSIIEIIEYCLGSKSCKIKKGVIRNNIEWYGLLLNHEKENIFVARKNPPKNQSSTNLSYILRGKNISSPENPPEEANTTNDGIVQLLTEILEFSANKNFPKEKQSRNPLSANIKHALFQCFQKQTEIASDQVLFHRQSEPHIIQDIKDTLPYFLGAIKEDELLLKQQLDRNERELRILVRSLKEAEMIRGDEISRAQSLIDESISLGIIEKITIPDSHKKQIKILENISKWKPGKQEIKFSDNLDGIQENILLLNKSIGTKQDEIKAAKKFSKEISGYGDIISHEKDRLESIGLFDSLTINTNRCPVCSNKLKEAFPSIDSIKHTLTELDKDLEFTSKERPIIREKIERLEKELQDIQIQLNQQVNSAEQIIKSREPLLRLQEMNFHKAQASARASFWLENVKLTDETSQLKNEIKEKTKLVDKLKKELDEKQSEIRLESILNRIGEKITKWARELDLEHSEFPVRFSPSTVSIIIDDENGVFPLEQIGSGENLLGYHLVTLFAFHEFYVKNNRPLPRFLIIDQPSQVYFPKDIKEIEDMKYILDEDREKLMKFYNFIFDRIDELKGKFQVIVTDHADIKEDRFQDSIVERWRDGNALVPEELMN